MDDEALDERLRALAHPVRRRLVAACLPAPRTAGALVAASGLAPASVSEHLKVLRKTGLLVLERDGRFRRYRADPDVVRATAQAIGRLADCEGPEPPDGLAGRPA